MRVGLLEAASIYYTAYQETLTQLGDAAATGVAWEATTQATRDTYVALVQNVINGTADPVNEVSPGVGVANTDKATNIATACINVLREYHG